MLQAWHWEGCYRTNSEGYYRPGTGRMGLQAWHWEGCYRTDIEWCYRPGIGKGVTGQTPKCVTGRALGVAVTGLALGGN